MVRKQRQRTEDQRLWQAFKAGEQPAFLVLYDQHFPALFQYCRQITTDTPLIEDTIHDLFLSLWERRIQLGAVQSIRAYLLTSARRRLLLHLRQPSTETLSPSLPGDSFEVTSDATSEDALSQALQALNPRQREVLYLKFYQNLSYQEVAESLAINVATVYKTAQRSLTKLKSILTTRSVACLTVLLLLL